MDFIKIGIGSALLFLGQVLVWFQAYAPIKFEWLKNKGWWFPYLLSIPIAFFFIKGIGYVVSGTNGEMWSSRIIGFSLGIISCPMCSILAIMFPMLKPSKELNPLIG